MSRYSTTIAITRESHISSIIQSFSTHFIIMFSKFRDSLDVVHVIYYSPTDIKYSGATNNLRILTICIRNDRVMQVNEDISTIWQFVRLYSPVLDSNVLSGYLSLNTRTKTFIQILIHQFRHYPVSQSSNFTSSFLSYYLFTSVEDSEGKNSKWYKGENDVSKGSDNSNFIKGITLTLKGRIQTEHIKPRKTVQSFIVGSHYRTQPVNHPSMSAWISTGEKGRHYIMSNTSNTTNSNYELGSYSISVTVTGVTEGV